MLKVRWEHSLSLAAAGVKSESEFDKQKADLGMGNIELWSVDQAYLKDRVMISTILV
jgi:hypothetical protein